MSHPGSSVCRSRSSSNSKARKACINWSLQAPIIARYYKTRRARPLSTHRSPLQTFSKSSTALLPPSRSPTTSRTRRKHEKPRKLSTRSRLLAPLTYKKRQIIVTVWTNNADLLCSSRAMQSPQQSTKVSINLSTRFPSCVRTEEEMNLKRLPLPVNILINSSQTVSKPSKERGAPTLKLYRKTRLSKHGNASSKLRRRSADCSKFEAITTLFSYKQLFPL